MKFLDYCLFKNPSVTLIPYVALIQNILPFCLFHIRYFRVCIAARVEKKHIDRGCSVFCWLHEYALVRDLGRIGTPLYVICCLWV